MAKVAGVNYESNYWTRRAARATGRFLNRQDRVLERIAPHGAGAITVLEAANRFVDITSYKEHLVKYALIVGAAYVVGYGVLRSLGWGIIKLGGALERVEVPPTIRDLKDLSCSLGKLTENSNDYDKFRIRLGTVERNYVNFQGINEGLDGIQKESGFTALSEALSSKNFLDEMEAYNKGLAPEQKKLRGLDKELYGKALLYVTVRGAREAIEKGIEEKEYGPILDVLDQVAGLKEVMDRLGGANRELLRRAHAAAEGLCAMKEAEKEDETSAKIEDLVAQLEAAGDADRAWQAVQEIMGRIGEVTDPALVARLKAAYDLKIDQASALPSGASMADTDQAKAAIDGL
jgi:DNA-binding FrmR family transcriptional regulator